MPGLYIAQLRVSRFRSYSRAQVNLDGRPVSVTGANGAGKTNLVEAVSLLSPGRGLSGARGQEIARHGHNGWGLAATIVSHGQWREVDLWSEGGASRTLRVDGKAATRADLARIARVLWLVPAMDRIWAESPDRRRNFLDRAALSLFPGHAEFAVTYEQAMRERNKLLRDKIEDPHWFNALEQTMAESGFHLHENRCAVIKVLEAAQDSATTSFPTAALKLVMREGALPEDIDSIRTALRASRPRDQLAGRSLVGPHRADLEARFRAKDVAARDCSTGEQKALLLSLILANARALKNELGTAPIMLLDEVAAHLDARRRAALYDEIVALDAQAFMTGTDPLLFTDLGQRTQALTVTEVGGESRINGGGQ